MNIGFVISYFPPFTIGGAEWSAYYLGQALTKAGHNVHVLTPDYGAPSEEMMEGIHVVRFPFPQQLKPGLPARSIILQNPFYYLYLATIISRYIRKKSLHVVHAQDIHSFVPTYLAARFSSIRCVATVRDPQSICSGGMECFLRDDGKGQCTFPRYLGCLAEFWQTRPAASKSKISALKYALHGLYNWVDLIIRGRTLRHYDVIIAVSSYIRDICVGHGYGKVASKIRPVPNIVPTNEKKATSEAELRTRYDFPQDAPLILFAGRLTRGKGVDMLLTAAEKVVREVPKAVFLLAGGGTAPPELPPFLANGAVRLLGVLPNAEILAIMESSAFVVLPAQWGEPLSRFLLEATSLGKAIVTTRVGGNEEIVQNGLNGILVEKDDSDGLARAMIQLLRDPERTRQMGRVGQRIRSERFTPEAIVPKVIDIYQGERKAL